MSTHEALRLADALEDFLADYRGGSLSRFCQDILNAAAELRWLHATVQARDDVIEMHSAAVYEATKSLNEVRAQRDALLGACKVALGIIGFGAEHDQVSAAIAAVEGETKV